MNYIDIIIIVFIGLIFFEGYKKGLIKMVFELIGLLAAFFISKAISPSVELFLRSNTKLYQSIHGFFQTKSDILAEINLQNSLNLPESFKKLFENSAITDVVGDKVDTLIEMISGFLIQSLSFLFTFLVIYLVLLIIFNIINFIVKLPILNLANKLTGAIFGIMKSVIILYIVFALVSPFIAFSPDSGIVKSINSSISGKVFYENNIILKYLSDKGFFRTENM